MQGHASDRQRSRMWRQLLAGTAVALCLARGAAALEIAVVGDSEEFSSFLLQVAGASGPGDSSSAIARLLPVVADNKITFYGTDPKNRSADLERADLVLTLRPGRPIMNTKSQEWQSIGPRPDNSYTLVVNNVRFNYFNEVSSYHRIDYIVGAVPINISLYRVTDGKKRHVFDARAAVPFSEFAGSESSVDVVKASGATGSSRQRFRDSRFLNGDLKNTFLRERLTECVKLLNSRISGEFAKQIVKKAHIRLDGSRAVASVVLRNSLPVHISGRLSIQCGKLDVLIPFEVLAGMADERLLEITDDLSEFGTANRKALATIMGLQSIAVDEIRLTAVEGDVAAPLVRQVTFEQDVAPILIEKCVDCHNWRKEQGDVRLDTVRDVMKQIKPGSPFTSKLVEWSNGKMKSPKLPKGHERLENEKIAAIVRWIANGAPFNGDQSANIRDLWGLNQPQRSKLPRIPKVIKSSTQVIDAE